MTSQKSKWINDLHESILKRNLIQTEPYTDLIASHQNLWAQAVYLENKRIIARHNLAIAEHDVNSITKKLDDGSVLSGVRSQLETIQNDLVSFDMYSGEEDSEKNVSVKNNTKKKISSDLSRLASEQKKLIANQSSELEMAKTLLHALNERLVTMEQSYMTQTVNLSGELDTVRKKLELAEMDNSNLRTENKELTTRIIEEKDKTASQMNAMNEIFDVGFIMIETGSLLLQIILAT
eukprot:gene33641-43480_t